MQNYPVGKASTLGGPQMNMMKEEIFCNMDQFFIMQDGEVERPDLGSNCQIILISTLLHRAS